jgi:hypothetical protein
LRALEGGTYEIDRVTGKSKHRLKDPELKKSPKATRRSIKKDERKYAKLVKKVEHANHILHPHHEKKHGKQVDPEKLREKAQDKREKADKLKTKAQVATVKRDIKQHRNRAFAGEVAKAWRGRTDTALAHREQFYEDLGRVTAPDVTEDEQRMRVGTYDTGTKANPDLGPYSGFTEGGLIERVQRKRVERQKKMFRLAQKDSQKEPSDERSQKAAEKRAEKLKARAEKHRKHESTTARRRTNKRKLNEQRRTTDERYAELRAAKQRLRALQQIPRTPAPRA